MNKKILKKANDLQATIDAINDVEIAFKNNHWIMLNTPDTNSMISISEPLYSDLHVFLQEKKVEYEKQFDELA